MGRALIATRTSSSNTGALAAAAWCAEHGLAPQDNLWFVEVAFASGPAKFTVEVFATEWGFSLHHDGRLSWIRVTDMAFVHERDDFELLPVTTGLSQIRRILDTVNARHGLAFTPDAAAVRTNLDDSALPAIRDWLAGL